MGGAGHGIAVRSFDVPTNTDVTLDPDTNYYVRIESDDSDSCGTVLRLTNSDDEDSSSS